MEYVVYKRVSTNKQGVSGLGLEAQEKAVAGFLEAHKGTVKADFTEVQSGRRDDNRPELQKALRICRLTGAKLLVAKLDRLSRSKRFLSELEESEVDFVCADMPQANKLTIGLLACLAEYESQLISERTKAALQAKKARGEPLGNPKVYKLAKPETLPKARQVKTAKANARKRDVLEVIQEIKAEYGVTSLRQIAAKLNEANYKTTRGCKWEATSVQRVLKAA